MGSPRGTFSEEMDKDTLTSTTFMLVRKGANTPVGATDLERNALADDASWKFTVKSRR